jgi:hypothetical protein
MFAALQHRRSAKFFGLTHSFAPDIGSGWIIDYETQLHGEKRFLENMAVGGGNRWQRHHELEFCS